MMPFSYGFFMIQSLLRGVGQTIIPLYIVAAMPVLSFVLVPALTFGLLGLPPLGILGAALANALGQIAAFAAGLYVLGCGRYGIRIIWREFRPDWPFIKRVFLIGYPSSIDLSMRGFSQIVMTFIIASFGTVATAAYGVGSNVLSLATLPAMSISMATSAL